MLLQKVRIVLSTKNINLIRIRYLHIIQLTQIIRRTCLIYFLHVLFGMFPSTSLSMLKIKNIFTNHKTRCGHSVDNLIELKQCKLNTQSRHLFSRFRETLFVSLYIRLGSFVPQTQLFLPHVVEMLVAATTSTDTAAVVCVRAATVLEAARIPADTDLQTTCTGLPLCCHLLAASWGWRQTLVLSHRTQQRRTRGTCNTVND